MGGAAGPVCPDMQACVCAREGVAGVSHTHARIKQWPHWPAAADVMNEAGV